MRGDTDIDGSGCEQDAETNETGKAEKPFDSLSTSSTYSEHQARL